MIGQFLPARVVFAGHILFGSQANRSAGQDTDHPDRIGDPDASRVYSSVVVCLGNVEVENLVRGSSQNRSMRGASN